MVTLDEFFELIFRANEGYVYLATKKGGKWSQYFFQYPGQLNSILEFISIHRPDNDLYFCPSLFKNPGGKKEDLLGSQVVWADFDGNAPNAKNLETVPSPSARIRTSKEGHEHWYWSLTDLAPHDRTEALNRGMQSALSADPSGINANHVLRIPTTTNFKYNPPRPVGLIEADSDKYYDESDFILYIPETTGGETIEPRPLVDVLADNDFSSGVLNLLKRGPDQMTDRSDGLMYFGHILAEHQFSEADMLTLLLAADNQWGKFKGRDDQLLRLTEIVQRAKQKNPELTIIYNNEPIQLELFKGYGARDLLATEIHLEWVWEGFLQRSGLMLLAGPPGVGKTQFSLDLSTRMVLGQSYLSRTMHSQKVGYLSLEMNLPEIKEFLQKIWAPIEEDKMDILQEKFITYPMGSSVDLTSKESLERLVKIIEEQKFDGLIIDSVRASTHIDITTSKGAADFSRAVNWLKGKTGVWIIYVHHTRKATGENKKPNTLDDILGGRDITADPTSVFVLWPTKEKDLVELIPLKIRLTKTPDPMTLQRDKFLRYTHVIGDPNTLLIEMDSFDLTIDLDDL